MTIQFKIHLRDIKKPPVWRRIAIPGDFTFRDLHNAIQTAFGWWNEHLYQFQRHPFDGGWSVSEPNKEDDDWFDATEDSRRTLVGAFIQRMKLTKFVYVYDFGDSWVHDITVEKIDNRAELVHPVCLAGKGACPPEDCGGPWGYAALKEEMDKDEINEFDLEEVNFDLETVIAYDDYDDDSSEIDDDDNDDFDDDDYDDSDDDNFDIDYKYYDPDDPKDLEKLTVADILKLYEKDELIPLSGDLEFDIDEALSKEEYRSHYAQCLIDNPIKVLSMLPWEDLLLLRRLKEHPMPGNTIEYEMNSHVIIMVLFGLASYWWDEDGIRHVWIPDELWQALTPHIDEVMNNPSVLSRIAVENTVLGLANLYGQVSRNFVYQELVRLGKSQTLEEASECVSMSLKDSLLLKRMEHEIGDVEEDLTDDDLVFVSPFGWDSPERLKEEIEAHEQAAKDIRLFSSTEISAASEMPVPQIPTPFHEEFVRFLMEELEMNERHAAIACHDLWYREMHKHDVDFEDDAPGEYFSYNVVYEYDRYDYLFKKGMAMLDYYLNNMPHWQLKGHTPTEARELLSDEDELARQERLQKLYEDGDYMPPSEFINRLNVTMPFIAEKKPGRNDPCPCGSGKKYKNCCGKGS